MAVASERYGLKTNRIDENTSENVDGVKIKLSDLKVTDIKYELDKRNLDKTGVKSVLVEKLKRALLEEGEDPEKYCFFSASGSVGVKDCGKKIPDSKTNGDVYSNNELGDETTLEEKQTEEYELLDDKMDDKNEITLQLSIDEDDAQLNDEENLLDLEKYEEESTIKEVNILKSADNSSSNSKRERHKETAVNHNEGTEKKNKTRHSTKLSDSNKTSKHSKVVEKSEKPKETSKSSKVIWVRSLSNNTRAIDVKAIFSKYGKVLSVKIVKSAKQTPGKCYGYVTMSSTSEANKAIQHLNNSELNGKTISVEWNDVEPSTSKKLDSKVISSSKKHSIKTDTKSRSQVKKVVSSSDNKSKLVSTKQFSESSKDKKSKGSVKSISKERDERSQRLRGRDSKRSPIHHSGPRTRPFSFHDRPRFGAFRQPYRSGVGGRSRSGMSMFERMRDSRFHFQEKVRERERRESDKRHKYVERKQQLEAYRLEREKEKLRMEREQLERERAEILKLEREMQILERERLEREKEDLRRQAELRESAKRPFTQTSRELDPFWDARKKSRFPERSSFFTPKPRLEEPSSSRYEVPSRERSSLARPDVERHAVPSPARPDFSDRQPRREVRIRPREERRVYERSSFKQPEERSSFPSRDRTVVRREPPRPEWKQERRVQERVVSSRSSGRGTRRMTFY